MSLIVYVFYVGMYSTWGKKNQEQNSSKAFQFASLDTAVHCLWGSEPCMNCWNVVSVLWEDNILSVALETTVWERKGGWTCDSLGEMRHRVRNNQITSVLCNMFIKVKIQVKNKANIRVVVCEIKGDSWYPCLLCYCGSSSLEMPSQHRIPRQGSTST